MLQKLLRVGLTLGCLALAVVGGWALWQQYMDRPWTRDGRIRADVISVAPDVAGLVTEVRVSDNQTVKKGDVLFVIDRARYQLTLDRSRAALAEIRADADLKQEQAKRRAALDAVVISSESQSIARSVAAMAQEKVRQAHSAMDAAELDLHRTEVRAPVDGFVVNLNIHPGDYAVVGKPAIAVVDQNSFRVEAYFEETRLPHVHPGDRAEVRMLGSDQRLSGHVLGIARAISEPDVAGLLSNVNPTFHWVRLAQRIPVTIKLDSSSLEGLASGMTCTVVVRGG